MNVHSNRGWIYGARTVCAAIVAIAAVMAFAPTAEAKKPSPDSGALVNNFISDLNAKFSTLDAEGDALIERIAGQLDAAVEQGQLNKVLNSERKFQNFLDQDLRPYEKLARKGEAKILKILDKRNADPALAQQVQDAVAARLADLSIVRANLESEVATMIDDAIEDIENQIDVN